MKIALKRRNKKRSAFFGGLIFTFFIFFLQTGTSVSEQIPTAIVEIDFSKSVKTKSMSGFLHSVGRAQPSDEMILPLKPKQWRTGEKDVFIYERIKKSGARAQIVLSDFWGYPGLNTSRKWAYQAGDEFEDFVRQTARAYASKEIIWDVWNEPDDPRLPFWKGTFRQFCETYLRAYKILREELGQDAMIGGPSFSRYNKTLLKQFLDFCVANNCEVNFLSWHELDDRKITGIADRLSEARRIFVDNPEYASLKIKEIQINEITGSRAQNNPAAILGYFYYLEKGGADGASKACWENSAEQYNCYNDSLDGLLTPKFEPTAAWWIYKIYADGADSRVASETSNPQVVALGSTNSETKNSIQVIVGYFKESRVVPNKIDVSLNLKNLGVKLLMNENAQIGVRKIQDTGEKAVKSLELVSQKNVNLTSSFLNVNLNNVSLGEVYLITVTLKAGGNESQ